MMRIAATLSAEQTGNELPVDKWHPTHCGELDLVIKTDGTWIHEGTPIGRPALVRLFSRVLRKDADGYVLVTPAEKLSITVEDVPFLIVDAEWKDGQLEARSNVGDIVTISEDHPIMVRPGPDGTNVPYVRIRGGLDARFARAAYYRLVEEAELGSDGHLRIKSGDATFDLGSAQ